MSESDSQTEIGLSTDTPILIVEDTLDYAKLLMKILSAGLGFTQIVAVHSVAAAQEVIAKDPERFKIMFVDYMFPSGDTGADFLADLKARGLLGGKIAFLITAHPDVDKVQAAADLGVSGLLVKPFDRTKLQNLLKRAADLLEG